MRITGVFTYGKADFVGILTIGHFFRIPEIIGNVPLLIRLHSCKTNLPNKTKIRGFDEWDQAVFTNRICTFEAC